MLLGFIKCMGWALLLALSAAHADVYSMKELFQHKKHLSAFEKLKITCVDCHSFGVKAAQQDPLGAPVVGGYLNPHRKVCHQCHVEQVQMFARSAIPVQNQCLLCHKDSKGIVPQDHLSSWIFRHGMKAQMNVSSCKECHSDRSCEQCHLQRDTVKPRVHRGNFRISHSIDARMNPQSCTTCHTQTNFCVSCHVYGGRE